MEEDGVEDLRLYQRRNASAETISIKEGATALPWTLRKKLMTAYAQLNADPEDLLADHELTVGE